jgi:glycerol-3-phosphate dehydrogenase
LSVYGSDEEKINALIKENPLLGQPLVNGHPYSEAEVVWAVRNEMARTVEDVLARRMRLLFLDARGAIAAAPRVAELMSKELGWNEETTSEQLSAFISLAGQYVLNTSVYKTINVQ